MTTLGLKNVNMLSKERYSEIEEPATDELYAISGSGFGFPSNRYDELELGASGTEYTAPANGWYSIYKLISSGQYFLFDNKSKRVNMVLAPSGTNSIAGILPVQKGDKITIYYTASGATNSFRFIYAEGE
jgi:hypothetical protein